MEQQQGTGLPVHPTATPKGSQGTGQQATPAPGYYWVLHSLAYRTSVDKLHADCGLNPVKWASVPFIAQWDHQAFDPQPQDWGWFTAGDDRAYESVDDLTIIAGPLQPPRVAR